MLLLIQRSLENWRTVLMSSGNQLRTVDINCGIFQGDSLSPLLFILVMMSLTLILNYMRPGYYFGKGKPAINNLLFMDDRKLYGKDTKELKTLTNIFKTAVKTHSFFYFSFQIDFLVSTRQLLPLIVYRFVVFISFLCF